MYNILRLFFMINILVWDYLLSVDSLSITHVKYVNMDDKFTCRGPAD